MRNSLKLGNYGSVASLMLNPANNLLESQKQAENKKHPRKSKISLIKSSLFGKRLSIAPYLHGRRGKIHFAILGVILVIFVFATFLFSKNLAPYLERNPSQGLLGLLPQDPYFLLCLKTNAAKPYTLSAFSLSTSHYLLKEIEALDQEGRTQKMLRDFNIGKELLSSAVKEVALAQYKRDGEDSRILILTSQDPQETKRSLSRYDFLEYSSHAGVTIYRDLHKDRVSYYTEVQNYFVFTQDENFLKEIIDLQNNKKQVLTSDSKFRQVWQKINVRSPIFVYTKQKDWPTSLSINNLNDNNWEINAFYPGGNTGMKGSDASWYRFIPQDAIGVLRGGSNSWQDLFGKAGLHHFWQDLVSFLDFSQFEENLAQVYNLDWQAQINSLIQDDFEMIAIPDQNSHQAVALVVPWEGELENRLEGIEQALGVIATSKNPRTEKVALPDGTLITEYMRDPSQDYIEEQYIAGIKVNCIDFGIAEKKLFYGRLGNKLILTSSSDAFSKIVSSFRRPAEDVERVIPLEFLKGQEWFCFDLEKLPHFSSRAYPRKVQGVSLLTPEGTLVKLWLEL